MTKVEQVHKLLDDAEVEYLELNGVFICKGANGNIAKISSYKDDETQFQVTLNGLTPNQAVDALCMTLGESE